MAAIGTAPCPHCRAENLVLRRECWRCANTLPTTVAADLAPAVGAGRAAERAPAPASDVSLSALANAVVFARGEDEDALPYAGGGFGRRLVWVMHRRVDRD